MILKEFLKTTFMDVRSSKRTDALHNAILAELTNEYPKYKNYDWKFEQGVDDVYGGTFSVDILGINKTTGKIIIILCKCCNSDVGKNIYNYANTTLGESHRLLDGPLENKIEQILFINVFPNVAPNFSGDGIKRFEKVTANYKNRVNTNKSLDKHFGDKAREINIVYDIKDVYSKNARKDFENIEPLNITKINLNDEYFEAAKKGLETPNSLENFMI